MKPQVGDKITGIYRGPGGLTYNTGTINGTAGARETYDLTDVEVVEPAMPVDEYPNGTVVQVFDDDPFELHKIGGKWFHANEGDYLHHYGWITFARAHVVKYRPSDDQLTDEIERELAQRDARISDLLAMNERLDNKLDQERTEYRKWQMTFAPPAKPRTVTTEAEYEALPVGSIVAMNSVMPLMKDYGADSGLWRDANGAVVARLTGTTRTVLREGWQA